MTTTSWTSETSWTVSRGSLDSVITFESFDLPIDSESTSRKPPLLLLPPSSSDFQPCQIKLRFAQKHEIRQVYVRSTARIYEIYYAPDLQSDDEYLCTVRCSAASVEDNTFPVTDVKEASTVNPESLGDILPKARVASENKIGTNEDDWVEVKLPVGPHQTLNNSQNNQNFYEATAEINDSEPCSSLTIRLLSLQSKGCVYVDEVYVFADPSDSNDPENQTVNAETSPANSLMTMLVPTLLGLTKSRSLQLHDQNNSNPVGKLIKTEPKSTTSTNLIHQEDETFKKTNEVETELTRSHLSVTTPDEDKVCDQPTKNEFSFNRTEILLEQLVTRVSRVEDICTRFEENMLKPLNSIEARLKHVEQQVESLGRRPVSPSFLRLEPNPGSLSNEGNDSQLCDEPELEKTVSFSSGTHKPPENASTAAVQEFPCCDEKVELNEALESPKKEKPKKTVSVDDALAAALAGFSSFTKPIDGSTVEFHEEECLKHNQGFIDGEEAASVPCKLFETVAPEFIGEENDDATTSCDVSTEIPDDSFYSHGISEIDDDEEAIGPTANPICSSSPPHEADKMLTFDKTDILKHFPDQLPDVCESRVDFESCILEVKFASFEEGRLRSPLEALLTNSDDAAGPATDEGVLIEEQIETTNDLLVDLDGDDIGEKVQQDIPHDQLETSFESLI